MIVNLWRPLIFAARPYATNMINVKVFRMLNGFYYMDNSMYFFHTVKRWRWYKMIRILFDLNNYFDSNIL